MKSAMYRSKRANVEAIPQTLTEYGVMLANSPMSRTVSNGEFYKTTLSDEIGGTSIVFGSPTFISLLPQATELHLDGTFKVRPNVPPSRQMLTVMSMHFNHVSVISIFNSLLRKLRRLSFSVYTGCPKSPNPISLTFVF